MFSRQPASIHWRHNMLQILLILPIALASPTPHKKMEGFIVGGHQAAIKQWPFIAFIEAAKDNRAVSACGGSLISSQTVLTAAHCLDDVTSNKLMMHRFRFTIYMGHSTYKKATMSRAVIDYETPKEYNPLDDDVISDIGVMFLQKPVKFVPNVKKVILKRKFDSTKDRYLEVAGWGKTDPSRMLAISQNLKSVGITAISTKKCQYIIDAILSKMICAESSHEFAYSGDSGGPLVDKDRRYLLGLVSFRDEPSGVTVYTSVPDYFDWIKDTQRNLFRKHCPPKQTGIN